ncbi:DUF4336 domain-containing protein [Archangium sp.]|uniref:DUF4336 domain-containing protein n=1 Tax=Archangium sp. TaxID=1872627 RepID=UPI00286C6D70|nr:DUF4336 domain-containing protein [Archangium sp.]
MLRALDENLWVAEQQQRFMGLEVGSRMTVIRLADGGLWVHSPLRMTPEVRAAVEALGPVRFLVAPNLFHHLSIGDWMAAYPQARSYAAPGLPEKRKDLRFHEQLSDKVPEPWAGQLDVLPWRGAPAINEVVFFHHASRTLLITDTAHNIGDEAPTFTRTFFKIAGGYGRLSTSFVDRLVNRDRAAARATVDTILKWDIQRVIPSHGHIVERDGARAFREAYAWL